VSPAAAPPAPPAGPELGALREELAQLRDELTALRAGAAQAQAQAQAERLDELQAALEDRERGLQALRAEADRLEQALARSGADPGLAAVGAVPALAARGVKGPTELDALLRSLGEARQGADLLRCLAVSEPRSLAAFLEDRVLLLGGCGACPDPAGRVAVAVPHARCDLCQGGDLRAQQRRFVDACLVNARMRILVVGGSARDQRLLRDLVTDRRLRLSGVPGTLARAREEVDQDLAQAQVVVLWAGPHLDPAVAALYSRPGTPVVTVEAVGPGPFLDGLARVLHGLAADD